jgi:hypothetical protein
VATDAWLTLMAKGLVLYPSITAGMGASLILGRDLPPDFYFWQRQDIGALRACSYMLVLAMPGWSSSEGIAEETHVAIFEQGIPAFTIDYRELDILGELHRPISLNQVFLRVPGMGLLPRTNTKTPMPPCKPPKSPICANCSDKRGE